MPIGESIVGGRSRCDGCGATIAAYDNVPVLSWLALRGRCRHCGASIPARYPLIELGLAASFAAIYLVLEDQGAAQVALGLVFATRPGDHHPDRPRGPDHPQHGADRRDGRGRWRSPSRSLPDELGERLIAAAAAGGGLLLGRARLPARDGDGRRQARRASWASTSGSAVAPALLIGFLAGSLLGVALIARHGAEARKQAIPFGPFLALGGLIGLLAGDEIVDWYTNTFFSG